jgi:rSAM/selenodomain-associated transferase 2
MCAASSTVLMANPIDLSIIIPTINEELLLAKLLQNLQLQQDINLEIIIADGGSKDETKQITLDHKHQFISSHLGRGVQMNQAAVFTNSNILLFLHADSEFLDPLTLSNAVKRFKKSKFLKPAGHFPLKFHYENSKLKSSYRYHELKTTFNKPFTINGDQGLMISRKYFFELGQFKTNLNFLEDQIIAREIDKTGDWILFEDPLYTSSRRFEKEGIHRRFILMSMIMGLYYAKVNVYFKLAQNIYQSQQKTQKLYLTPYFLLAYRVFFFELSPLQSLKKLYLIGHFVRLNSWQLFYWFDIRFSHHFSKNSIPFLKIHDRLIYPFFKNPLIDLVTTILTIGWFFICLPIYFIIIESFSMKRN